ncbi:MAG: WG repeat-containing protein [Cyclobacteriaceae bacterium]
MRKKLNKRLTNSNILLRCLILLVFLTAGGSLRALKSDQWRIIKSGHFEGLANAEGEVIIPPVYDAIGWSDETTEVLGDVIGYLENEKWGLVSLKNKKLTSPQFTILEPYALGKVKAAIKGKFSNHLFYGIINNRGQVIVDFNHFSIDHFHDDMMVVSQYANRSVFYGLIDGEQREVLPSAFTQINMLGDLILGEHGDKKKLFDLQGDAIFDFWLDSVTHSKEGFLVMREGKYGFVNSDGSVRHKVNYKNLSADQPTKFNEWRIFHGESETNTRVACDSLKKNGNDTWTAHVNETQHLLKLSADRIFDNSENVLMDTHRGYLITQNTKTLKWSAFKESGESVLQNQDFIRIDQNYLYAQNGKRWDVYNYFGRKLNDKTFGQVLGSVDRKVAVRNHGYWGWMDFDGKMIVNFRYDHLKLGVRDDQFIIKYVGHWGVADFHGQYPISPDYDKIRSVGGLYVATKGHSQKIFSADGVLIHQTTGHVSGEDLLMIKEESGWGAVLNSGFVVEPAYDTITTLEHYILARKDAFVQLFDPKGNLIVGLEDRIQDVLSYDGEWFVVRKADQYGFVDEEGRLRIANRYDDARPFSDGLAAIRLIGKWGFVDKKEQLTVQPFYNEVGDFEDGLAVVRIHDQYGIVNKGGNEIVDVEWKSIERQPTGNFVVVDFDDNYGLVNAEGAIILSPIFESLEDTPGGAVVAKRYGKKGVLDYKGFSIHPFAYADIEIVGDYTLFLKTREN